MDECGQPEAVTTVHQHARSIRKDVFGLRGAMGEVSKISLWLKPTAAPLFWHTVPYVQNQFAPFNMTEFHQISLLAWAICAKFAPSPPRTCKKRKRDAPRGVSINTLAVCDVSDSLATPKFDLYSAVLSCGPAVKLTGGTKTPRVSFCPGLATVWLA